MKSGIVWGAAVLVLGVPLGAASAQGAASDAKPSKELRVWLGASLGSRDRSVSSQLLSAFGVSKDLQSSEKVATQVYLDSFRVVSYPAEVLPRERKDQTIGLGVARRHLLKDKTGGNDGYYGFGLGFYNTRRSDTFPGVATKTEGTLGVKLMAGTGMQGPYFLHAQLSIVGGRSDYQVGVGRKF
jgi:hypothetical protein